MSSNLKNEKAAAEAKDIEVNVDAVGVENPLSTGKFVDRAFQLNYWDPEDDIFYAKEGEAIANRNLICSIPNLFLGFAIWLMWSATVVVIQEAYDSSKAACVAAGETRHADDDADAPRHKSKKVRHARAPAPERLASVDAARVRAHLERLVPSGRRPRPSPRRRASRGRL